MNYKSANQVFPKELLVIIQDYIDGEYIYIPRKSDCNKKWGEKNGYREKLNKRNQEIYLQYKNGCPVKQLADEYYLSEKSIYKIVARIQEQQKK